MKRYFFLLIFFIPLISFKFINNNTKDNQTKVLVLGTIHNGHRSNPNYLFDFLFKIIDNYNPDIVGIEIRPEDMNESDTYLGKSYPPEMIQIKNRYAGKKIVVGFDWLGVNLEGKLIPENYWNIALVKTQQRAFAEDSSASIMNIKKEINVYNSPRMDIFKNGTALELNTIYDSINSLFYNRFKTLLRNTEYNELSEFYESRDNHIGNNMVEIIKRHKGKRIILITGIDHKVYALAAIRKAFKNKIEIVDLKNIIHDH